MLHLRTVYAESHINRQFYSQALEDGLFWFCRLQGFARELRRVCDAPTAREPGDFIWNGFANLILNMGIEDSVLSIDLATADQYLPETAAGFMNELRRRSSFDEIWLRWTRFFTSCHHTCAYRRADLFDLLCEPHKLVEIVHETAEIANEVAAGMTMQQAMHDRYGFFA